MANQPDLVQGPNPGVARNSALQPKRAHPRNRDPQWSSTRLCSRNRRRSHVRRSSSTANRSKPNARNRSRNSARSRNRNNGRSNRNRSLNNGHSRLHALLRPRRNSRNPRSTLRSILRSINKTMIAIDHQRTANRFTAAIEGHVAALDYTLAGNIMSITHTHVPPAIEGRGVAAELMQAALSAASTNGWTVNPVCSYAVAYLRRHPLDPHKQHVEDLLDEALDESFPASDSPSVGGSS
jgi:uncharacterized protein